MLNPFQQIDGLCRTWVNLSDIDEHVRKEWNTAFLSTGMDPKSKVINSLAFHEKQRVIEKTLISIVREELDLIKVTINKPYVFVLTDHNAVALDVIGPKVILDSLEQHNVGVGTSFALEHAGINAISVAMLLHRIAIVQGGEHSLDFFTHWSCVCLPIHIGSKIFGYLDLSLGADEDVTLAVPLIEYIVRNVEHILERIDPEARKMWIIERLSRYDLTNKEKEVGYYWFEGKTRPEIAKIFILSENTVRTHINNLSEKMGVRGRVEFSKKIDKNHPIG